jgi:hypothetical protein
MSIYELDISWAVSTNERRYLGWELLASDSVCGVFHTADERTLAVLFSGDRHDFREWAHPLRPTTREGVMR